jgi:hypothetical protein
VVVYVVGESGSTPKPTSEYALLLADGAIRCGTTDRRGAVVEVAAPEGEISLLGAAVER